ncbi:MAG: hypothetical protein RIB46_01270 [Pseudomonadales bacterium]
MSIDVASVYCVQVIRLSLYSNAGAIVAVLTFLGQVWGVHSQQGGVGISLQPGTLKLALGCFALGLFASLAISALWSTKTGMSGRLSFNGALALLTLFSSAWFAMGVWLSAGVLVDGAVGGAFDSGSFSPEAFDSESFDFGDHKS